MGIVQPFFNGIKVGVTLFSFVVIELERSELVTKCGDCLIVSINECFTLLLNRFYKWMFHFVYTCWSAAVVMYYCMVILPLPHMRTQLAQKEYFHLQKLESTSKFGCQCQKIEINDTGLFSVFLKLIEYWQSCHILLHQLKKFWDQIHIVILYRYHLQLSQSTKLLNNDFAAADSLSHWSLQQQGSL